MAFLETHGIVKTFPGVVALKNIDIAVDLGEIHILAGENGAGKSTLVKVLVGAYRPTAGTLSIEGRDPLADPALFDLVAYVPQELSLFPNMTLAENLFMPFGKAYHGKDEFFGLAQVLPNYLDVSSITGVFYHDAGTLIGMPKVV